MLRWSALGVALAAAVGLGASAGSARYDWSEWGCIPERIGTSIFTNTAGGGSPTPDEAALAQLQAIAGDGALDRADYAAALSSRVGSSRYEPKTGKIYVDGRIQAQLALTQLADGTWATDNLTLCMRSPSPRLASPFPTPGA
jgi:hypothetical protein